MVRTFRLRHEAWHERLPGHLYVSAGQTVALFLDADSYYKKHPQSNKKDRSSHNLPLLYITNDYELDITYKLYYTKYIRSLARTVC